MPASAVFTAASRERGPAFFIFPSFSVFTRRGISGDPVSLWLKPAKSQGMLMLFKKYHVVIFKERGGDHRNFFIRGWLLPFLILLIIALAAGNVYLFRYVPRTNALEARLERSEKTVDEQSSQLINMTTKLRNLQADLTRIREFDSKLRVMMNVDKGAPDENPAMGGPVTEDFSKTYLPLHRQELLTRKMHTFIKQLDTDVRLEEVRQQELFQALRESRELLASTPSIWPTEGWITSPFGGRNSPFTGRRDFHKGIDISAPRGSHIYAPAKGTVTFSGNDGAYGNCVTILHGNGVTTRYGHMQRTNVKQGQVVNRGDIIGFVGSTGRSTGPHLHYEVMLNGVCVNPMRYILD